MKARIQELAHADVLANIRESPWFMKASVVEEYKFRAAGAVNSWDYNNYSCFN